MDCRRRTITAIIINAQTAHHLIKTGSQRDAILDWTKTAK